MRGISVEGCIVYCMDEGHLVTQVILLVGFLFVRASDVVLPSLPQ